MGIRNIRYDGVSCLRPYNLCAGICAGSIGAQEALTLQDLSATKS